MLRWLAAAFIVCCSAPAAAGAATIRVEGNTIRYEAGPGEGNVVRGFQEGGDLRLEDAGAAIEPGAGCRAEGAGVACAVAGIVTVFIELRDGDDNLTLRTFAPVELDAVVRGGRGNDAIEPGSGDDIVEGGSGRDGFGDSPGADVMDGGSSVDEVGYVFVEEDVEVSVDGQADDGRGGEGDNVVAVENITTGEGDDEVTGTDRRNRISTGGGDDMLRGEGARDRLRSGGGDDRIDADDGAPDVVRCGRGRDRVRADADDDVARACNFVNGFSQRRRGHRSPRD